MFTAHAQVQVDRPVEQVWSVVVDRRRDPARAALASAATVDRGVRVPRRTVIERWLRHSTARLEPVVP